MYLKISLPADFLWGSFVTHSFRQTNPKGRLRGGYLKIVFALLTKLRYSRGRVEHLLHGLRRTGIKDGLTQNHQQTIIKVFILHTYFSIEIKMVIRYIMMMAMMTMMMMIKKQDTCNHRYYIIPLKGEVLDYPGSVHVNLIP